MLLVFGLAYEVQKHWHYGWMVCAATLLGVLLFLLGLREKTAAEIALQGELERYCGKKKSKHGKNEPVYGNPYDTRLATGDDRPLPRSLKNRVDAYIRKRLTADRVQLEREIVAATSFNAFIRKEYRAGRL